MVRAWVFALLRLQTFSAHSHPYAIAAHGRRSRPLFDQRYSLKELLPWNIELVEIGFVSRQGRLVKRKFVREFRMRPQSLCSLVRLRRADWDGAAFRQFECPAVASKPVTAQLANQLLYGFGNNLSDIVTVLRRHSGIIE